MTILERQKTKSGFTLIELLVVIAIISILAAILFPVFANAREKARQSTCVSNIKQILIATIQYEQDNNETCPMGYNQSYSFGTMTQQFNTAAVASASPSSTSASTGACGVVGQPCGLETELQTYANSSGVFTCPDDHPQTTAELAHNNGQNATESTANYPTGIAGLTYAQAYGTSYQFDHAAFSNPFPLSKHLTGYATNSACTNPIGNVTGQPSHCDLAASGETITGTSGSWTPASGDVGAPGYGVLIVSSFARPDQTKIVHEWNTSFVGNVSKYPFHTGGTVEGFVDGHARFVVSGTQYDTGCDGIDWAWDTAGSCNIRNLQRDSD